MSEKDSIADVIAEGLAEATPVVETPAPVAETPAPVAATPSPAPQAPAAAEQPKAQEAIPLATALDWRDQLKASKRELEDLRAKHAAAQPVPPAPQDPEAFAQYVAEQNQRVATSTRFEVSELMAREKHGDEVVQSAMDWAMKKAESSPAFALEYIKQKSPINWAVQQQKRDTVSQEIGDDVDAYWAKNAERLGYVKRDAAPQGPVPQPTASAPATPAPTRSLASAQSAGGGQATVPSHPTAAIDAVFR